MDQNTSNRLNGKKIAILVADGFEQVELTGPRRALEEAGAQTQIVSSTEGKIKGWKHTGWGDEFSVDVSLESANADDYDGLLLPGGVMNPHELCLQPKAVGFVKAFFDAGKPVAAICYGPWTLAEAELVEAQVRGTHTDFVALDTDSHQ